LPIFNIGVPYDPIRARRIRELKGLNQQVIAERCGVVRQGIVSGWEAPGARSENTPPFLERLATALECRTDYLLCRCLDHLELQQAVSLMAFEIFESDTSTSPEWRARCRRVLGHSAAPLTVQGWKNLAEQIDLAVGSSDGPQVLRSVTSTR
jgi:transcriptional regulator with XRE-family HTH domain